MSPLFPEVGGGGALQLLHYLVIGNFLNEGSISREEFNPFGRLAFCDIQGSLGEMIHRLLDKKTNRKQF